jgi:hypothetical protein
MNEHEKQPVTDLDVVLRTDAAARLAAATAIERLALGADAFASD